VDYLFIYRSVAQQHGLKFLTLPDEVNLGNPALRDWYEGVSVRIRGNRPDEFIEQKGEPMVYGLTIPRNAPHPAAALAFARFILEADNGRRILERLGQPSVIPAPATGYEAIPEPLKIFAAR
jgi:molybdate/tungstate transport system substrate-binding protein